MTDEEKEILQDFKRFDLNPKSPQYGQNVPEGYERVGPSRWAWDMGFGDEPSSAPVPCVACGHASNPSHRVEFVREGLHRPSDGWKVGIALFVYDCPEHGWFFAQAVERGFGRGASRNGHRVSIS
ncbi:MAG: hypothetical protein WBB57_13530 [Mycobacterium sp.]